LDRLVLKEPAELLEFKELLGLQDSRATLDRLVLKEKLDPLETPGPLVLKALLVIMESKVPRVQQALKVP
jgi:hypothetical protein